MKELVIDNIENAKVIKDILYGSHTGLEAMIPLKDRKNLWNEQIRECIDREIERDLYFPLYRGIVIQDSGNYDQNALIAQISEYKTGSFSSQRDIANSYSYCGYNGNLDVYFDNYYSIILRFIDGEYINVNELLDKNDLFEKWYNREKEFYCFPEKVIIEKIEYYGTSILAKKIVDSIVINGEMEI